MVSPFFTSIIYPRMVGKEDGTLFLVYFGFKAGSTQSRADKGRRMQWIWVGTGGALGSLLRFFLQGRFQAFYPGLFPLGTLAVNLMGSAVIGMLAGFFV